MSLPESVDRAILELGACAICTSERSQHWHTNGTRCPVLEQEAREAHPSNADRSAK